MLQRVCFAASTDHVTIPIHGGGHTTARPELAQVEVAFGRSRRPETDAVENQRTKSDIHQMVIKLPIDDFELEIGVFKFKITNWSFYHQLVIPTFSSLVINQYVWVYLSAV